MVTPIEFMKPNIRKNIVKTFMLNTPTRWKYGSFKYRKGTVEMRFKDGKVRDIFASDDIHKYMKKSGLDKEYY